LRISAIARTIAAALRLQSYVLLAKGDLAKALQSVEASADASRRLGDDAQLASSLNALAELSRVAGRLEEAKAYYEEGIALHRRNDDGGGCAVGQVNLAVTNVMLGDLDAARRWFADGMGMVTAIGSRRTMPTAPVAAAVVSEATDAPTPTPCCQLRAS